MMAASVRFLQPLSPTTVSEGQRLASATMVASVRFLQLLRLTTVSAGPRSTSAMMAVSVRFVQSLGLTTVSAGQYSTRAMLHQGAQDQTFYQRAPTKGAPWYNHNLLEVTRAVENTHKTHASSQNRRKYSELIWCGFIYERIVEKRGQQNTFPFNECRNESHMWVITGGRTPNRLVNPKH